MSDLIHYSNYRGYEIRRRVVRVAYAKNGNADNPTPDYSYAVYSAGTMVEYALPRLRDAKHVIDALVDGSTS
jgi:hypothetical protein